jgi:tRNA(Arg) A34 adenosine deaminase TadA
MPLNSSPVTFELIMAPLNTHEQLVRQAIALASRARDDGNHPFGALLALNSQVVLTAMNSVNTDRDPTGHAETNLIARAIWQLSPEQIRHAVLYTSCEPCAMCAGKMYWAGIRSVVYALSAEELAVLAGPDFLVPCRDLFGRATEAVTVIGPMLVDEAHAVHVGFWTKPAA